MDLMGWMVVGVLSFEDAKVYAGMPVPRGRFGFAVDVHLGVAAIGGCGENESEPMTNMGTAWLVRPIGDDWSSPDYAELKQPEPKTNNFFGSQVALGDTCVVVSAQPDDKPGYDHGSVFMYDLNTADVLGDPYTTTILRERWGDAVAVSRDCEVVVVGVPGRDMSAGEVEIFNFDINAKTWTLAATIVEPDGGEQHSFGDAVAIIEEDEDPNDDDEHKIVAIGTNDLYDPGRVYIVRQDLNDEWYIGDMVKGDTEGQTDSFGIALAFGEDGTLIVGATEDEGTGAVYVCEVLDDSMSGCERLVPPAGLVDVESSLGSAVRMDGEHIYAGAKSWYDPQSMRVVKQGAVFHWNREEDVWTASETLLLASDGEAGDSFGKALGASGGTVAVGAEVKVYEQKVERAGAVYVFIQAANGSPCLEADDCLSGACVDKVCDDEPVGGTTGEEMSTGGFESDGDASTLEPSGGETSSDATGSGTTADAPTEATPTTTNSSTDASTTSGGGLCQTAPEQCDPGPAESGCSCAAAGGGGPYGWLFAGGLLLFMRRRSSRGQDARWRVGVASTR